MAGRMLHSWGRWGSRRGSWALALAVLLVCRRLALAADWEGGGGSALAEAEDPENPTLGPERVVFQTEEGDIEFAFFPRVAPVTVAHILKLARMGCYTSNHFFRVDRGFVAQVADVMGGRTARMNAEQRAEAQKRIVGEFSAVKHVRGILSMGRYDDPNSAGSSFSMLLGNAPHLDGKYAVFGKVTAGDEVLRAFEALPTRRDGIFVMPLKRITILSTYVYEVEPRVPASVCNQTVALLRRKLVQMAADLQETLTLSTALLGLLDAEEEMPALTSSPSPTLSRHEG